MNGITQLLLDSSLDQVDFVRSSFTDSDDLNDLITVNGTIMQIISNDENLMIMLL